MPYPGLEVVVQYWLYSLVDDWHSTPRSVAMPGAGTVRLPGINQHHEGDWEAVTVGLSADRPLFVDWSAHCAGEWRPFAGATLAADAGGERTHPVSWVALGSHANLADARDARARAGGTATRASATFVHQRVEALIGPVAVAALGSRLDDALGILDRAGSGAPQAFPLTLVNRITWPMTFPGIWGGRERIEVGPAGRALGWSPPTPTLQPLWRDPLATIFGDASRSRGRWHLEREDCKATGMSIPRLPVPWRTPVATAQPNLVEVAHYTDAACPWAYNFEPTLRALEARYGDQLNVRTVMIGLSESYEDYVKRGYTAEGASLSRRRFRRRGMPMATGPRPRPFGTGARLPPRQGRRAAGRAAGRGGAARAALRLVHDRPRDGRPRDAARPSPRASTVSTPSARSPTAATPEVEEAYQRDRAEARSPDALLGQARPHRRAATAPTATPRRASCCGPRGASSSLRATSRSRPSTCS